MSYKKNVNSKNGLDIYYLRSLACSIFLVVNCVTCPTDANAQSSPTLQSQEKQWRSCEGGYYAGPREGRRNFRLDKYLWVVTPEFAKRFCMPESMVSNDLKGAEAIAFRMVDGADSDVCGVDDDGKAHCTENSTARFEIYLPSRLNLPAVNPQVKFFEGSRTTSDWQISNIPERISKSRRYEKGEYQVLPGQLPHFANPYAHPDRGYGFGLLYAHEGKGRWPVSPLWEVGFRGAVMTGLDMLILENQLGIFFGFEMRFYQAAKIEQGTKLGQYLIVMDTRNDARKDSQKDINKDYAHVIYLPHEFGQQVRQVAMKQGGSNWLEFIKTIQQR